MSPSRRAIVRALAIFASLAYLAAAAMLMTAVEPLGLAYEWAARLLGISRPTLYDLLKAYGLQETG